MENWLINNRITKKNSKNKKTLPKKTIKKFS